MSTRSGMDELCPRGERRVVEEGTVWDSRFPDDELGRRPVGGRWRWRYPLHLIYQRPGLVCVDVLGVAQEELLELRVRAGC